MIQNVGVIILELGYHSPINMAMSDAHLVIDSFVKVGDFLQTLLKMLE